MEWKPNPAYRKREPWNLHGRSLWVWRVVMLALVAWALLTASWVGIGLAVAGWVAAELLLRRQRNGPGPREG